MKKNTPFLFFKNYKTKNMENTKQFILTLIIVFLCALSCKSKTLNVTYLYKEEAKQELIRKDNGEYLLLKIDLKLILLGRGQLSELWSQFNFSTLIFLKNKNSVN